MAKDVHFSSDFEAAEMHRRSHGDAWAERLVALLVAVVLGMALVSFYNSRRIIPEELALGAAVQIKPGVWNGVPVNAHALPDYPKLYPPAPGRGGERLWLWLGNSQLHSINQLQKDDEVAPVHASRKMEFPVFGLSVPNASLRDHYIIGAWALARSRPEWLIIPVVFDDLREYDLRPGYGPILDQATRQELGTTEPGRLAVAEVDKEAASQSRDAQGTSRLGFSLQDFTEKGLNEELSEHSQIWRDRDQAYAAVGNDVYRLRNWVFRIESRTKRPVIQARLDANMQALSELLSLAQRKGVRVLVYVAPTRWDVEPPYFLDRYEAWKSMLMNVSEEHGAAYADLDHIVPDNLWGVVAGGEVDFMHFQGPGHVILANRILEEITKLEEQRKLH
jgi:hypothetical protein